MATSFSITPEVQLVIDELEIQRKKIASNKLWGWGLIIFAVLSFFFLTGIVHIAVGMLIGFSALTFGIFKLVRISDEIGDYKARFKQEIIGAALVTIDPSLTLDPKGGIWEEEFTDSQLFSQGIDAYKSEDLVCGTAGKTSFYFAEVHAQYKTETSTKDGRRTEWHDILKGIVFVADFNKNFQGVTIVRPKNFGSSIGAWFSKNIFSISDKDIIDLENVAFGESFITHCTNQIEARYILTPAMMERICDLNNRCYQTLSISFINSSMYIAFPLEKNHFEPPVFKTLLRADLLDDDLSILNFMYAIVEELDLNTRIWTKS